MKHYLSPKQVQSGLAVLKLSALVVLVFHLFSFEKLSAQSRSELTPIENLYRAWETLDARLYARQWAPDAYKIDHKKGLKINIDTLFPDRVRLFSQLSAAEVEYTPYLESSTSNEAFVRVSYTLRIRFKSGQVIAETSCETFRLRKVSTEWLIAVNDDHLPCQQATTETNQENDICLLAHKESQHVTWKRLAIPGITSIRTGNIDINVETENGKFLCHADTARDGKGVCNSRISDLTILIKGRLGGIDTVFVPTGVYSGLEDAHTALLLKGNQGVSILLVSAKDGASARTVCMTIEKGKLTRRATMVGFDPSSFFILEDTRFK